MQNLPSGDVSVVLLFLSSLCVLLLQWWERRQTACASFRSPARTADLQTRCDQTLPNVGPTFSKNFHVATAAILPTIRPMLSASAATKRRPCICPQMTRRTVLTSRVSVTSLMRRKRLTTMSLVPSSVITTEKTNILLRYLHQQWDKKSRERVNGKRPTDSAAGATTKRIRGRERDADD